MSSIHLFEDQEVLVYCDIFDENIPAVGSFLGAIAFGDKSLRVQCPFEDLQQDEWFYLDYWQCLKTGIWEHHISYQSIKLVYLNSKEIVFMLYERKPVHVLGNNLYFKQVLESLLGQKYIGLRCFNYSVFERIEVKQLVRYIEDRSSKLEVTALKLTARQNWRFWTSIPTSWIKANLPHESLKIAHFFLKYEVSYMKSTLRSKLIQDNLLCLEEDILSQAPSLYAEFEMKHLEIQCTVKEDAPEQKPPTKKKEGFFRKIQKFVKKLNCFKPN